MRRRVGVSEKATLRQLHELIVARYGDLRRFCRIHHYEYAPVYKFLKGIKRMYNNDMFEVLSDQANMVMEDPSNEVVLLERVVKKYCGGEEVFRKSINMWERTYRTILLKHEGAAFKRLCLLAYSQALHKIEKIEEYMNTQAPAKFLLAEHARTITLNKLSQGRIKRRNQMTKAERLKKFKEAYAES